MNVNELIVVLESLRDNGQGGNEIIISANRGGRDETYRGKIDVIHHNGVLNVALEAEPIEAFPGSGWLTWLASKDVKPFVRSGN